MRRSIVTVLTVLVVVPAGIGLSTRTGLTTPDAREDSGLSRLVQDQLDDEHGPLTVALVTKDTTQYASLGTDRDDEYEIASLTKLITAQLLTAALDRNEVELDTQVGDLLDVDGAPGRATLEQLVTYTAGFGEWGPPESSTGQLVIEYLLAGNPWSIDTEEMLARARRDPLSTRGRYSYSNLGFALLGQSLAAAADMSYDRLLTERVLQPLDLSQTHIGYASDLNQSRGFTASGRRSAPWNLQAFAPAGGVRSTIGDIVTWARTMLDPASAAGRTMAHAGDVGWGWYGSGDDPVRWKSGGSGGFASAIAVDPDRRVAVVVLSASAVPVDRLARTVLRRSR